MSDERDLLRRTAELAADYLDTLGERPVFPQASMEEISGAFDRTLPQMPSGGTTWDGRTAIRVSVSSWRTTEADIDRTVAAFETARATV